MKRSRHRSDRRSFTWQWCLAGLSGRLWRQERNTAFICKSCLSVTTTWGHIQAFSCFLRQEEAGGSGFIREIYLKKGKTWAVTLSRSKNIDKKKIIYSMKISRADNLLQIVQKYTRHGKEWTLWCWTDSLTTQELVGSSFGSDGDSLLHPGVVVEQREHEASHVSSPHRAAHWVAAAVRHKVSLMGQELLSCGATEEVWDWLRIFIYCFQFRQWKEREQWTRTHSGSQEEVE